MLEWGAMLSDVCRGRVLKIRIIGYPLLSRPVRNCDVN